MRRRPCQAGPPDAVHSPWPSPTPTRARRTAPGRNHAALPRPAHNAVASRPLTCSRRPDQHPFPQPRPKREYLMFPPHGVKCVICLLRRLMTSGCCSGSILRRARQLLVKVSDLIWRSQRGEASGQCRCQRWALAAALGGGWPVRKVGGAHWSAALVAARLNGRRSNSSHVRVRSAGVRRVLARRGRAPGQGGLGARGLASSTKLRSGRLGIPNRSSP
jgi:hypothetical protein